MSTTKITVEIPDELVQSLRIIAAREHMNQTEAVKALLKGAAKMDSVDAILAIGMGKESLPTVQERLRDLADSFSTLANAKDPGN